MQAGGGGAGSGVAAAACVCSNVEALWAVAWGRQVVVVVCGRCAVCGARQWWWVGVVARSAVRQQRRRVRACVRSGMAGVRACRQCAAGVRKVGGSGWWWCGVWQAGCGRCVTGGGSVCSVVCEVVVQV